MTYVVDIETDLEPITLVDSMSPASPGVVLVVDDSQLLAVLEREGYIIASERDQERNREVLALKRFFDDIECHELAVPEMPITYGPVKIRKGKPRRW